ncbi:hypothetical protein HanPI659440_Chr09g0319821 [Helianthus annuus]|nr:hypothetical protein HanPI659440_Chr09g0319821 [Helianthus annuus]
MFNDVLSLTGLRAYLRLKDFLKSLHVYDDHIGLKIFIASILLLGNCEIMWNLLCLVQVDQSTVAITETFGKYDDVLESGCHCVPWIFGSRLAGHLTLRVQQLDVKCETKTKHLSVER